MDKQKVSVIDQMMAELFVYQDPRVLLEQYSKLLDTSKVNATNLKKYQELLSIVREALNKVLRYELYFASFYSTSEEISDIEALNHHIHAYLQDSTILRNKIEVLLGTMKNDIRKLATNKKDIEEFFKAGIEKTDEVFKSVLEHRDKHHHEGRRFLDGDLLRAENAESFLKIIETPIMIQMLNPARKPELIARHQKEKEESFESAKKHWIEMARKNNEQVSGYVNALLEGVRPALYQFLEIKQTEGIFNLSEKA